jgi:hypothetical protein
MVSTNDFMLMVGREVGAKIGVCPSSPYKNSVLQDRKITITTMRHVKSRVLSF